MKRRLVRLAGYALLALSVVFLGQRFYSNFSNLTAIQLGWPFYVALAIACISYGVLLLFAVAALKIILKGLGAPDPSFTHVLVFHGRTNIAKYLPGNIFHFVGRQMIAKSFGWSQATVGISSLIETGLVALGAGLSILLFACVSDIAPVSKLWPGINPLALLAAAVIGIAILWLICAHAVRIPLLARYASATHIYNFSRSINPLLALLVFTFFFLAGGTIFWSLKAALTGGLPWHLIASMGFAYSASWLIGNVSPGAPGGIGVREAMLVLLLGGIISEAEALMLAAGMRIVTIFGDFFLFGLAAMFKPETLQSTK
jgi:uncharacterized membrane protein YbhN (UPF0104 family)